MGCCWCAVRLCLCVCASRGMWQDRQQQPGQHQGLSGVQSQPTGTAESFPFSYFIWGKYSLLPYQISFLIISFLIIPVSFEILHIGKHNFKKYCVTLALNKWISGQILSDSKYLQRINKWVHTVALQELSSSFCWRSFAFYPDLFLTHF